MCCCCDGSAEFTNENCHEIRLICYTKPLRKPKAYMRIESSCGLAIHPVSIPPLRGPMSEFLVAHPQPPAQPSKNHPVMYVTAKVCVHGRLILCWVDSANGQRLQSP